MAIQVVILAAGLGTRMRSALPKVLHRLAGKSLIEHVIAQSLAVSDQAPIIIYGHQGQLLRDHLAHLNLIWVEQKEQLGTGHALLKALPTIKDHDDVLVLYGDVPLISSATLKKLISETPKNNLGLVTAFLSNPSGYGRIKRDHNNQVVSIIEDKDTNEDEKEITEINSGIYFVTKQILQRLLPNINNSNEQREYYLTDLITLAKNDNIDINTVTSKHCEEILGVNDRLQLALLERFYQRSQTEKLMSLGVTLYDPTRVDIRGDVRIGEDSIIDVNVIFEGQINIGRNCIIGPNVLLRDTIIGDGCEIKANSVIEGAVIAASCQIGPFARVRPGSVLKQGVHIGNFVEIKNSLVGDASKINHLSYIGDCEMGSQVNIGAGTITCNYDGVNKHKTIIGNGVFIGSDTQLVAPISIGNGAVIGAGSTLTKTVPADALTLTQKLEQRSFLNWKKPMKENVSD